MRRGGLQTGLGWRVDSSRFRFRDRGGSCPDASPACGRLRGMHDFTGFVVWNSLMLRWSTEKKRGVVGRNVFRGHKVVCWKPGSRGVWNLSHMKSLSIDIPKKQANKRVHEDLGVGRGSPIPYSLVVIFCDACPVGISCLGGAGAGGERLVSGV
ncbi:unnamed protein product [Trypanosoma congolense IL3000]|uniref:WGS project CAEQ00000000 data, annotated contig 1303 n=1 Tax=Trypanosoma congolense (strain IL3000) TaxID=1068625 RepID=F9W5B4_TRYCI|nr:unnamed protein product [Trypanosoma congolense IL3000]